MRTLNTDYILSPQQLTSCDTDDSGCNGGWPTNAYEWIESTESIEPTLAASSKPPALTPTSGGSRVPEPAFHFHCFDDVLRSSMPSHKPAYSQGERAVLAL